MKIFGKNYDDEKIKKIAYRAVLVVAILWFIYRFVMVAVESQMVVYNPIRAAQSEGILVETVVANQKNDIIKMPIDIKNNRAYVSGEYRNKLRAGQKVDEGEVASVSSGLDLDTGMYVVRTRGVSDGVRFVSVPAKGYFIPAYAVRDGVVMVIDSGVAVARQVDIVAQDMEYACVVGDIKEGDIVILSKVTSGQKIKVK
ncbi:MAG: hypothetical protein J5613_00040 [Alphaproteobacteria bacterium]|nr:hypothetical protein [Alphaproteobacteria bacterium]